MRRPAFTILEMVVVILLVIAISAVVLPSLAGRVTAGKMGFAVRMFEVGTSQARTEAITQGSIVALVAERDKNSWVLYAEPVDVAQAVGLLVEDFGQDQVRSDPLNAFLGPPPSSNDPLYESEKDGAMPKKRTELASFSDVLLVRALPESADSFGLVSMMKDQGAPGTAVGRLQGAQSSSGMDTGSFMADAGGQSVRVTAGLFFPDGSCRPGKTLYLIGKDGTRRSLHFGPLTGRLEVRNLPSVQDEAAMRTSQNERTDDLLPEEGRPGASRIGRNQDPRSEQGSSGDNFRRQGGQP